MLRRTMTALMGKTVNRWWPATGHRIVGARSIADKQEMFSRRLAAEETCRRFKLPDDVLAELARRMARVTTTNAGPETAAGRTVVVPTVKPRHCIEAAKGRSRYLRLDLTGAVRARSQLFTMSTEGVGGVKEVFSKTGPLYRSRPGKCEKGRVDGCQGASQRLFDSAADRLSEFASAHSVLRDGLPLIVTFGYPVHQTHVDSAVVHKWTKEMGDPDTPVGQEVVTELLKSISRRTDLTVGNTIVLNDACAALLSSAFDRPTTRVAVVVDDGSNCSYVESATEKADGAIDTRLVNTEWGSFGENGELKHIWTKHDENLDSRSNRPGSQIFEKMTSGMYMGELVRLVVLDMVASKTIFGGSLTLAMKKAFCLDASSIFRVVSDPRGLYDGAKSVLRHRLAVENPTEFDCELFRFACDCVTERSAQLVSAGVASVLRNFPKPDKPRFDAGSATVVAVQGHAFAKHPKYSSIVKCKVKRLTDNAVPFELRKVDDNFGDGTVSLAAVVAEMAKRPKALK